MSHQTSPPEERSGAEHSSEGASDVKPKHPNESTTVPRMWARLRRIVRENRAEAVMVTVALVVLGIAMIPSPYAIERPGPVVDVLGTVPIEGEEVAVLTVEDAVDTAPEGTLNLLTVSIAGSPQKPLSWIALIPTLFDSSQEVAPVAQFYPEGITVEQREQATSRQMDASQVQAATAAFRELGLHVAVTLTVGGVDEAGPATGLLQTDDVIVSIDGATTEGFEQLLEKVSEADGELEINILRDGAPQTVQVTPMPPGPGQEPRLGTVVSSEFELPREVDISVPQIGGPSAGLIFALAIMDRMGEGASLDGLTVSGTGTLTENGRVGGIGGLTQKAWAAERAGSDLFLMPLENCVDVKNFPRDLAVAPVGTLAEAVSAIDDAAVGKPVAGLERCKPEAVAEG